VKTNYSPSLHPVPDTGHRISKAARHPHHANTPPQAQRLRRISIQRPQCHQTEPTLIDRPSKQTTELSWQLRQKNANFSFARTGSEPLLTSRHAAIASLILVPVLLCVLVSWRLNRVPPPAPFTDQELALISQLASRSSATAATDRPAIAAAAQGSSR
jgi:hypothetical protein